MMDKETLLQQLKNNSQLGENTLENERVIAKYLKEFLEEEDTFKHLSEEYLFYQNYLNTLNHILLEKNIKKTAAAARNGIDSTKTSDALFDFEFMKKLQSLITIHNAKSQIIPT